MLNTEKIYVAIRNGKETTTDYLSMVTCIIRNAELSRIVNRKSWKDAVELLNTAHLNCDYMTLEDTDVNIALGLDASDFLKARAEVLSIKSELATLPVTIDVINAMSLTDRVNLTLQARMSYKFISLLDLCPDVFNTEKGGIDVAPIIRAYYANGKCQDAKNCIVPTFNKLLGHDSDLFKALKLRKSGIPNDAIRNFMATFGGVAQRVKSGKGENVKISTFHYIDKSTDKAKQFSALTTLLAVLVDNATLSEIVKDEKTAKATKTAK